MLDRLVTVGSSTLSIRSVTFQNSLRLAAGLALALVLGGVFEVENGFWVLFATLSVVRTSAPMTGASAFQAVFGTVIGFAIALPLLLAIGTREDLYLLVLPIVTVGGLLAGSLNVVWGQAGFTVLVLVLFNLVDPIGWEIGIIRVEDVALGAAVGVLIGLAAWPRCHHGAVGAVARRRGRGERGLVAATMEGRLRPVSPERLSRLRSARAKTLRADGVLAVFLTERPKNFEDVAIWEQVSMFAHTRWYGAEMLARQSVARPPPEAADLVEALVERVHELDADHAAVAAAIARREPPPPVRAPINVELLDPQSRRLVANPPVDDPWAARGVVDILRTRALLAEITISLIGMRDLVSGLEVPRPSPAEPGAPSARYQFRSVRRPRRDRDEVERLTRRQRLRIERHEVDRCLGRQRLWVQGHQPDSCSGWQRLGVEGNEVDRRLRRQRLRVERDEFDRRVRRQRLRVERDELDVRVGRQGLWVPAPRVDARLVH